MISTIATLTILFLSGLATFSQGTPDPDLIRGIQRNVAAIKVHIHSPSSGEEFGVGCGVVLMTKINGQNTYFMATANHIIEPMIRHEGAFAEVMAFDKSGVMLKTSRVNRKHVIWRNQDMDAALLVLPKELEPQGQIPPGYTNPGPSNLKMIGEPAWGQDIYLLGYRWINQDFFLDILKKGILSVGTTELPGYRGQLVYLIDNMANKGMSGGLAFTEDGTGIGIISSYVFEVDSKMQNSDDLTVCLPLTFFFKALESVIAENKDKIIQLSGQ